MDRCRRRRQARCAPATHRGWPAPGLICHAPNQAPPARWSQRPRPRCRSAGLLRHRPVVRLLARCGQSLHARAPQRRATRLQLAATLDRPLRGQWTPQAAGLPQRRFRPGAAPATETRRHRYTRYRPARAKGRANEQMTSGASACHSMWRGECQLWLNPAWAGDTLLTATPHSIIGAALLRDFAISRGSPNSSHL